MKQFEEYIRKVHLFHDQEGATIKHSGRRFANTLCKMNSDVPESHITSDPDKVTCSICRKDRRFKVLQNSRFGKLRIDYEPALQHLRPAPIAGVRTRYRLTWRGKLVLQVQETYNNANDRDPHDMGQMVTRWRDAKLEDLGAGVV